MKYAASLSPILVSLVFGLAAFAQSSLSTDRPEPVSDSTVSALNIEFRIAQNDSAEGLVEATTGDTDETIYLHKSANLTSKDIAHVLVATDANGQVVFTIGHTAGAQSWEFNAEIGGRLASATVSIT